MRLRTFGIAAILLSAPLLLGEVPPGPTKMLAEPSLSSERVAFIYAEDVWTCRHDGSGLVRITSGPGFKRSPVFSPDGRLLAFSAEFDGNLDVYLVPAAGGVPRRLTWHPGRDMVQGFTPSGKEVLFSSPRAASNNRHTQLYTIPIEGGLETQLPVPHADRAAFSPDGKTIAYTPNAQRHLQWKRYRGGTVSRIWLYDVATHAVEKVPQPEGRCNDANPFWVGDTLWLRSDRDGEFNIYSYDREKKTLAKLTRHEDFPVLHAASHGKKAVYEQAGQLYLMDVGTLQSALIPITVNTDLLETRPRWAKGAKWVRSVSLSPSGSRVAVEFRGEIVTVPARKGDPRNLTNTPGAHERSPVWSPDGTRIAYVSDEGGEYELFIRKQDGSGSPTRIKVTGAGFYDGLTWSPDGKKIAFTDNSWTLHVASVEPVTAVKKVASERLYAPDKTLQASWSPDSRWLAYTLAGPTYIQTLHVFDTQTGESHALTDGLSDVSEPVFDRDGKLIYFLASTDAGPVRNWFSQTNEDDRVTRSIYVATLKAGTPSPLAKESDEEGTPAKDDKKEEADPKKAREPKKPEEKTAEPVVIDREGFTSRIVNLPLPPAAIKGLSAGAAQEIWYLREADGKTALQKFEFKTRKAETILSGVDGYELSRDAKKLLTWKKDSWTVGPASKGGDGKGEGEDGKLEIDSIQVRVDPRAEWNQIFEEAWRINRDYFYDPGMHGRDWKAMKAKYAPFLPHLSCRTDLNRLLQWMSSELAVGHHRVFGGDTLTEAPKIPGGLLGADYEVDNGKYRFKKVYGGLNWNPELRAPLSEPGVEVKAGEYLLAVQGKDLAPPENLYKRFEATAGTIVEITVGPAPDGKGKRTVKVVPVAGEEALRNQDWVEGNLRKVEKATAGRVAYVYVPDTATRGHTYFKRYFYPQAWKDAVIIDERFNGGGSVADYYIEALLRPEIAWWTMRYGEDMKTPSASIQGPKVMLIDETAGSGGDLLPWMFRKFKVGPLVGQRTWGGLVGILGFPVLMDGGYIMAPNLAFWTPEEGFGVENVGVPPDIEVEQTPAEVIAGKDPQLEKAIEIVMKSLEANPPHKPKRPPFPVR